MSEKREDGGGEVYIHELMLKCKEIVEDDGGSIKGRIAAHNSIQIGNISNQLTRIADALEGKLLTVNAKMPPCKNCTLPVFDIKYKEFCGDKCLQDYADKLIREDQKNKKEGG